VELDATTSQLLLVTGPNMAGKSTYLRQAALIVLLAQIGSFVPAAQADIGVTDRIFTRIGAQDDLAAGQSTFMVEMLEVANILNHATPHSLVILDEVGRGTGTFDGLAIARAVIEYLHNSPGLRCRTLFATHYLELTELTESLPRVRCCTVAVSEEGERVIFHHHIVPGRADRSYGVHVARLAGVPRAVVRRAEEVLAELESEPPASPTFGRRRRTGRVEPSQQMSLFDPGTALREEIRQLDVLSMTPMEALNVLHALKQQAEQP
jgi:DNA mismatch repair protein MutS